MTNTTTPQRPRVDLGRLARQLEAAVVAGELSRCRARSILGQHLFDAYGHHHIACSRSRARNRDAMREAIR